MSSGQGIRASKTLQKLRTSNDSDTLKSFISAPSDFRHLAHTQTASQAADVLSDMWKTGEKLPSPCFQNAGLLPLKQSTSYQSAMTIQMNELTPSVVRVSALPRPVTATSLSTVSSLPSRAFSLVTVEKSAATKVFFEGYFDRLFSGQSGRSKRRSQLETDLELSKGLSNAEKRVIRADWHQKETEHIRTQRERISIADFNVLKPLGQGAFGSVKLAREKRTGDILALKIMDKESMLLRSQEGHVRAERDLLSEASDFANWIVRLYYSFQDDDKLYLAMEYMPGGDLLSLLIRLDVFSESMAKFYAAEMILALEEAHKLGFVHRDIKPDNFLFTETGHLKLGDFGLATSFHWLHDAAYYQAHRRKLLDLCHEESTLTIQQDEQQIETESFPPTREDILDYRQEQRRQMAYSVVGTSNYIAPEILLGEGHDKRCDWWSLGIILYEMLIGYPAFCSSNTARTKSKIINWKKHLRFPVEPSISHDAQDLIERFICGHSQRLSCDENADAAIIKKHSWFRDIGWTSIRESKAPWIPVLKDELDTTHFDEVTATHEEHNLAQEAKKQAESKLTTGNMTTPSEHQTDVDSINSLNRIAQQKDEKAALELRKRMAFKGFTFKTFKGRRPNEMDSDDSIRETSTAKKMQI